MNQLHLVPSIAIDFGGLGVAALRYAQSLALAGSNVTLYVIERNKEEIEINEYNGAIRVDGGRKDNIFSQALALIKYINRYEFDVIHMHGTWSPVFALVSYIIFLKKTPLVISPHGCLEPWALQHRGGKKSLALALYQKKIFQKSSMMLATAKQELDSIRRLNIDVPVAVIPNGVDFPKSTSQSTNLKKRILFLSRIHPKKGLPDLISAWAIVRRPGWSVVIAGADEGGHINELYKQIDSLGLKEDFIFAGLVVGEKKENLFSEADIFILPTYSENFGIAVAEALVRGLPVITTTGAPWQDLESWQCGWWVNPGVESVAAALKSAMSLPKSLLNEMGQRGVSLVKEKYAWDQVGRSAIKTYEWILNKEKLVRPACIDVKN
ncbi:glycosyltransferase [Comamonas sp. Y33R10-2]|uniref:glycosyltransferase n=1 Tax=Comamonas sp. Y33R10-2 TaxID=2853257 RepID=UPI001C5CB04D|nr:glycosyltransferase [Comamonas sp. Y33R10-2]QXZ09312.1 glycosyltransferase [Comamonas sp. Y33R10-2]